jgi:hypothetical protein
MAVLPEPGRADTMILCVFIAFKMAACAGDGSKAGKRVVIVRVSGLVKTQ